MRYTERWFTTLKTLMVACVYILGWTIGQASSHPLVTCVLGLLTTTLVSVCFIEEERR